jgi:hypothetical protein
MYLDKNELKRLRKENKRRKRVEAAIERRKEQALETRNEFGIKDPTPKAAVDKIIDKMINGGGQNM